MKNAWDKIWYSKYDGGCMAMYIEKMHGLQRVNKNNIFYSFGKQYLYTIFYSVALNSLSYSEP